jgi:NAD(P) transhydrogenase subunit beta
MISQFIIAVTGFVAAFLLMYGLKRMSSPATAASGIRVAGVGMLAAVIAAFLYCFNVDAAAKAASVRESRARDRRAGDRRIDRLVERQDRQDDGDAADGRDLQRHGRRRRGGDRGRRAVRRHRANGATQLVVTLFGAVIGAISLSGSLIAWAKLDGVLKRSAAVPRPAALNVGDRLATVAFGARSSSRLRAARRCLSFRS